MSPRHDSATPSKKWKLEILNDEIRSSVEAVEGNDVDEEERALMLAYVEPLKEWVAELKGVDRPAPTANDIEWRIHVVDNRLDLVIYIIENEEDLDEEDLRGLNLELKKLKNWKIELEKALSGCKGS